MARCKSVLRDKSGFSVEYEALTVLAETDIIVASPCKTAELSALHCCLGCGYWEHLDHWSQEEIWMPHTTLVYGPDLDLNWICGQMQTRFRPFAARIAEIEFSRVTAEGYKIVDYVRLCSLED